MFKLRVVANRSIKFDKKIILLLRYFNYPVTYVPARKHLTALAIPRAYELSGNARGLDDQQAVSTIAGRVLVKWLGDCAGHDFFWPLNLWLSLVMGLQINTKNNNVKMKHRRGVPARMQPIVTERLMCGQINPIKQQRESHIFTKLIDA